MKGKGLFMIMGSADMKLGRGHTIPAAGTGEDAEPHN